MHREAGGAAAANGVAAVDSVEVAILVSLALFLVVSRATAPTPAANLRIFFN